VLLGLALATRLGRLRGIEPALIADLLPLMVLGAVVGARLYYVAFEWRNYQGAWWEAFAIWRGGMSFHGGFAGVILAGVLYSWRYGLRVASVGDCFAITAPIGLFLGRLANFVNGELWGRPSAMPWAVAFPGTEAATCPPDWAGICARHPSQLYEAALEGLFLGALMFWLAYRRGWLKRPGQLSGLFFLGYGAARSFVELFRQADLQFIGTDNPFGHVIRFGASADSWGLTMGQCLSLPMIAIGLVLIWRARRAA